MILNKNKDMNVFLNYLFVAYALVIPISRAGIVLFSILICIIWFFQPNFKTNIKYLAKNKFSIIFILFIIYTFVGLLWSSNLEEGIDYAKRYWYYLPMFIIATNLKKEYLNIVLSAFLIGMLISEIISYGIFFELLDIKNKSSVDPTPFMNHIQYSVFVVFTSLFLLNKIYFTKKIKYKIIYSLFFLTVTTNIFINGGRIGYITFFVSLLLVISLNVKSKIKVGLIFVLMLGTSLYAAYNYSPTFQARFAHTMNEIKLMQSNQFHKSLSIVPRLALYDVGTKIILENPIFGTGTGEEMSTFHKTVNEMYPQYHFLKIVEHFHNIFLHTAVQLGLLGLILQLLIFYYLLKIKIKNRYYLNIKYIFMSIYLMVSMSGNMFHQQFTMALFALMVGIFLAINRHEKRLD